jgi:hypothetical protein
VKAEEYLVAWKKMKLQAMSEETGASDEALIKTENKLKDKLFIQFGEDVDDIFAAFKHYGLNPEITEEDRKKYGH